MKSFQVLNLEYKPFPVLAFAELIALLFGAFFNETIILAIEASDTPQAKIENC